MNEIRLTYNVEEKRWPGISGLKSGIYKIILSKELDDISNQITVFEFEDKLFRLESAVVLPEREDPGTGSENERKVTPVGIIASCLRYAQEHPNNLLLVAGHTDTAGNLDYNKKLSAWRAENILALLTNNGKRWAQICNSRDRMKSKDYNQILAWVSETRGFNCHPGQIDDSGNDLLVNEFRKEYNKKGPGSTWAPKIVEWGGAGGEEVWEAYFNCYQDYIAEELGVDIGGLNTLQSNIKYLSDLKWVGCNEYHPRTAQNIDDFKCESNRRVEVLIFEPKDEKPALDCDPDRNKCSGKGCALFDTSKFKRIMREPMTSAKAYDYSIRLLNVFSEPIPDASYVFKLETGLTTSGTSDAGGWITISAREGLKASVEWGKNSSLDHSASFIFPKVDLDNDRRRDENISFAAYKNIESGSNSSDWDDVVLTTTEKPISRTKLDEWLA